MTKVPLSRSPYRVATMASSPEWKNTDWLPASAVIMPDKKAAFFSMVTLPADCGYPSSYNPATTHYTNGDCKNVVPTKHSRHRLIQQTQGKPID